MDSGANEGEDIEMVKHMWAFNMPCILLINGGREYWTTQIQPVYKLLFKDELVSVRQSLAAGLLEVGKMLELEEDYADSQ